MEEIIEGVLVNTETRRDEVLRVFTPDFCRHLKRLHHKLNLRRIHLLATRKVRQRHFDQGKLPEYIGDDSIASRSDWSVREVPLDLRERRVEITGPVNDTKMVINMLSANERGVRADMAMLDFEDSMKPSWNNVISGYTNVIDACNLTINCQKVDDTGRVLKDYRLDPKDMAGIMVRVRGLHMNETNVVIEGRPASAGLLDLATCYFHTSQTLIERGKTPKYYVPKCEHFLEAEWWNDLFTKLENYHQHSIGTLRATFLIETLPAAFQMEEILFELRDHAAGLNVGRWDKIFSDIKVLKNHPRRISADRATINMDKFWMDNYAKRLVKICHARGAFAIGGMSSFTPGKDADVRQLQTKKVTEDKTREATLGHDGCWVSHPYFIDIARECFTKKNQLDVKLEDFTKYPKLIMDGTGPRTLQGLRTNIRVGIAYLRGWNNDIGCVSWDGLMEDLATLEISRAQTWQWLHHKIALDSGERVTKNLVECIFDEELERICNEVISTMSGKSDEQVLAVQREFVKASEDAKALFTSDTLCDFLTVSGDNDQEEKEEDDGFTENMTRSANAI
jgi:malate synthase